MSDGIGNGLGQCGPRWGVSLLALALVGACANADLDIRDLGNGFDTSQAALRAVAERPAPDNRGIISYPEYQVAVARRGDTVADVAARIGLPAEELATFNGAPANATLNRGEVLALPRRVAEPSPATGAPTTGPIRPSGDVSVTALAGAAIDRAETGGGTTIERAPPAATAAQSGAQPVRHRVARGETAFSIARRYQVPPEALAEWNGLDRDYTLREGQYLLIPPARPVQTAAAPTAPGAGSPTPTPPSAAAPLPEETPVAVGQIGADDATEVPESPNLAQEATAASASNARMQPPVSAPIIRDFNPARQQNGLDFGAAAGTPVRAAAAGTVARVTRDTQGVQILILRHENNLLTVYANVDNLTVAQGDRVSAGQNVAQVHDGDPAFLHFEVREGVEAVDPSDFIQ